MVHRLLFWNPPKRQDNARKLQIKCLSLQIQLADFRLNAGNIMNVDATLLKFVSNFLYMFYVFHIFRTRS